MHHSDNGNLLMKNSVKKRVLFSCYETKNVLKAFVLNKPTSLETVLTTVSEP